MRIVHVIQGVFNASAGPTYSVAKLADELYLQGHDCQVSTIGAPPVAWPYRVPLVRYDGFMARQAGISLGLWRDLRSDSARPAILHGHGVWRASNLFPLFIHQHGAKIIVSPRGMLSEWSMRHKRLRKRPFWLTMQRPALNAANAFHATAQNEYEDIRRNEFRTPVIVLPNGVEIPERLAPSKRKQIVFMSRIDPKKGLDMLLPAWASVAADFPEWELKIAGPLGSAYASSMQRLARDLAAPRLEFVGEVGGANKRDFLSSAALFVLPTYSENFGIAVTEALAHGTAVITTTGTPWTMLDQRACGWCVDPTYEAVCAVLRAGMETPIEALTAMGLSGRAWMEAEYGWSRIGAQMCDAYQWLMHGGSPPACVVQD
jgi:glycosyltransferase involved in cell wall biosynthesis